MQFQSKYNAIFIRTSQNESKEYSGKEEKNQQQTLQQYEQCEITIQDIKMQ